MKVTQFFALSRALPGATVAARINGNALTLSGPEHHAYIACNVRGAGVVPVDMAAAILAADTGTLDGDTLTLDGVAHRLNLPAGYVDGAARTISDDAHAVHLGRLPGVVAVTLDKGTAAWLTAAAAGDKYARPSLARLAAHGGLIGCTDRYRAHAMPAPYPMPDGAGIPARVAAWVAAYGGRFDMSRDTWGAVGDGWSLSGVNLSPGEVAPFSSVIPADPEPLVTLDPDQVAGMVKAFKGALIRFDVDGAHVSAGDASATYPAPAPRDPFTVNAAYLRDAMTGAGGVIMGAAPVTGGQGPLVMRDGERVALVMPARA